MGDLKLKIKCRYVVVMEDGEIIPPGILSGKLYSIELSTGNILEDLGKGIDPRFNLEPYPEHQIKSEGPAGIRCKKA
ncbi:MAG: hypothetical protein CVU98_00755 [Firmicutes bacterium HGW-Firmicutes-3]|jgi:hypothetical protein|nr:MAG: hypothetical protein CVU98_00755 [Firmicutes bacterium HGW-Firmicutes-3]